MTQELNEVFDENTKTYSATNLKPTQKIPQIWQFDVPGNKSLMARMVSFASDGDVVKNVKMGDKFVQVFLMSLSDKGNAGELKGGLGSDTIGAITTIFDTVAEQAKKYRFDAVLFRLPIKKMQGQSKAVQRIMARLAVQRTNGKFVVLKELWNHSKKYAYVLIRRKNVNLEDIPGIPEISSELFTAVETKIGNVYVDKNLGNEVSKDEAIAATIAKIEDDRTNDRAIAAKTKISRRNALQTQYSNFESRTTEWPQEMRDKRDKLNSSPPVYSSTEIFNKDVDIISKFSVDFIKMQNETYRKELHSNEDTQSQINILKGELISKGKSYNSNISINTIRSDEEIEMITKKAIDEYLKITDEYNGKNHIDIFKKLGKLFLDNYSKDELTVDQRSHLSRKFIEMFNDDVKKSINMQYKAMGSNFNTNLDANEKNAIKHYCSQGYSYINEFLIGSEPAEKKVIDAIHSLDEAFEKGLTIPKNTPLYRGMKISKELVKSIIKNKFMYFANYASSSLVPLFVTDYGSGAVKAIDDIAAVSNDIDDIDDNVVDLYKSFDISIGIIIKNADSIKTLIPGELTKYTSECEVILPRGTMLKIQKVWSKNPDDNLDSSHYRFNAMILETVIVPPDQIDESFEEEDGLMISENSGKFSFFKFINEEKQKNELELNTLVDSKNSIHYDEGMSVLLDLVSCDNMSEKFVN